VEDATHDQARPATSDRGASSALAFTLPWAAVSLLLPAPHRYASLALVAMLAVLLAAAARWSWRRASERGLDADRWAFLATVTFGASMMALLLPIRFAEARALTDGVPCAECGRVQLASEPFCFSCGAQTESPSRALRVPSW